MKSIRLVVLLTAFAALSSFATSQAATRVKHVARHVHSQMASGAACSDPSKCKGHCTGAESASMTHPVNASAAKMSDAACPGMDPSKCPAGCRSDGAKTTSATSAAMTAKVTAAAKATTAVATNTKR